MTTKEAIKQITDILQRKKAIDELYNSEIDALYHMIEIAQRFESAVEVEWTETTHPNNPKRYKLYAIPKEQNHDN
jgi:hypothetical protein